MGKLEITNSERNIVESHANNNSVSVNRGWFLDVKSTGSCELFVYF